MILIFSIPYDYATNEVVKRLKYQGQEVVRINRNEGVFKFCKITEKEILFEDKKKNKVYNLLDAKSCWWRRTGLSKENFLRSDKKLDLSADGISLNSLTQGESNTLSMEADSLIDYIHTKIFNSCKVNIGSPSTFDLNKLNVLELASKHGLKVPQYEIVSNLNQIEDNSFSEDKFVTKAICEGIFNIIGIHQFTSYTESYDVKEFASEQNDVNVFPSLVMEQIEKEIEIRAFFLAGVFYSMAIFSQTNEQTKVDFRKYDEVKPNKCEPFILPKSIEEKLKKIFKELDLNCGSVDIILDANGDYVFLEINPIGQYNMTSEPCNYNLDYVIANYLTNI